MTLEKTIKNNIEIGKLLNINLIPNYIYYDEIKDNKYNIIGISVFKKSSYSLPIKFELLTKEQINNIMKKYNTNYVLVKKYITVEIDRYIEKNDTNFIDKRVKNTNIQNYLNESYNIFKLELSNFIKDNEEYKNNIINLFENKKNKFLIEIKKILYDITLNKLYVSIPNDDEITKFKLNNYRYICSKIDKDNCNKNIFCKYNNGKCKSNLKKSEIYNHINRLSNEMLNNELIYKEILNIDNYYVSDIINKENYIERDNQIILKSSNIINLDSILKNIFMKGNIPNIGKKKDIVNNDILEPIKKYNNYYIQNILQESNTIYRSFVNCLYWIKNELLEENFRNLGFYSDLQSQLANYFKGSLINWLLDITNKDDIMNNLNKHININDYSNINKFIYNISTTEKNISNNIYILYILNKLVNIPIVVYNDNFDIIYVYDNGISKNLLDKKYYQNKKLINILYEYNFTQKNPSKIKSIYFI